MSHRNTFYYDQASNVTCVRDDDLGLTYHTYDLLNRATSLKNPFGEVTYYEYLDCGQVGKRTLGNGCLTYYEYDVKGRVTKIDERESDMTQLSELQYEYDKVGNPIKIEREDGSATYYEYDRTYQLTDEVQVDDQTQVEYDFAYEYDGAHNRTVKVDDGTPTYYTYNAANQMLTETTLRQGFGGQATGAATTYYHYDGCGNTTAKQAPAGTTYYQYDTENLMTRIDFPDNTHSYYTYDADSKRVSQRTTDGYSEFIYEGPDMLKLQMERDENGDTKVQYTMGNGLEAVRRDAGSGMASGDSSFYHYNHLGTTIALTNAAESVSDTYRHDAWGVQLSSTGSTVNPHTYVGQQRYYHMPNADLYHLGFRDYAQRVGRFTTLDPVNRILGSPKAYVTEAALYCLVGQAMDVLVPEMRPAASVDAAESIYLEQRRRVCALLMLGCPADGESIPPMAARMRLRVLADTPDKSGQPYVYADDRPQAAVDPRGLQARSPRMLP
jgi:YD repeat-containing protein